MRFDISAAEPIVRVDLDLEGDNEPAVQVGFGVGLGFDGRYVRALSWKPTVNSAPGQPWPLVLTAWDTLGRSGTIRCVPGVTVTP